MQELISYLEEQGISYQKISDKVIQIANDTFELVLPTEGKLFDEDFYLIADPTEFDNYIFNFGGKWYYSPSALANDPQLNRMREFGKCTDVLTSKSFLGIHSAYEILNGVGLYKDWIKRAKFLGVENLGICEKNSLAGALKFQIECLQNKVKPIIGATYTIYRAAQDYKYDIKCYVKDEEGWNNLLMINKEVNVINNKYIEEDRFLGFHRGLVIVLDPKSIPIEIARYLYSLLKFDIYYQLDTVEYEEDNRDKEYLLNLQAFTKSPIPPIAITDAYYLTKDDAHLKVKLNNISDIRTYKSTNQYFKSKEAYYLELADLCKNDIKTDKLFIETLNNENKLVNRCNFLIPQEGKHLPQYSLTEDERQKFESNEDLFWDLIGKGLNSKVQVRYHKQYLERIEKEVSVIEQGGFIDYFLILWDIVKWSNKNGILTGVGRGSAGGSLVSYLLDITRLDPIEYNLLFERFLNEGRVGKSLPDIDLDFAAGRRDEVKSYMERRYGNNQVCSVGTYASLQIKGAIKDMARLEGVDISEVNWVTTALEDYDSQIEGLFKNASQISRIKNFVQEHSDIINDSISIIDHPKSQSIHACATLILPNEKDIFHWLPVKSMPLKNGETILVSEWEGGELEAAGFLKEDILGIRQLDKFQIILELVKKNRGIDVDIYNLPTDDEAVYDYFRKGWTQDVFHFGAKGLTNYCKQLQPNNIEELIAAIALYRPGVIESNLHNEFILRMHGERDVEYLWGTQDITKNTYGIIIYQEQVMQICVKLGGFSMIEGDDIRKALGKKKHSIIEKYRERFIDNAVSLGCDEDEAIDIWEKLEKFASYSFNRSHAAAYALTGYICQYLKVHFPIEYWTASFQLIDQDKKDELIPQYISEINKMGAINFFPPDINKSGVEIISNIDKNAIYWSLSSIKQIGDIAAEQLLKEREEKGAYFSFDEFLDRHMFKGSKVNKTVVENLIFSGAFDQIENIKAPTMRRHLLNSYYEMRNIKDEDRVSVMYEEWWWGLKQKSLCELAIFDYRIICDEFLKGSASYIEQEDFQSRHLYQDRHYVIGGVVLEVRERRSQKGLYGAILLESNYEYIWVTVFPDYYSQLSIETRENLKDEKSLKILVVSGLIKFDEYKKENTMRVVKNSDFILLK